MLSFTTPGRTGAGKNCWTRRGIQAFRFSSAPMEQLPTSALFSTLTILLFFGLKKWLCSFFQIRRDILNVCRKSPLNRLVFLDPYGTLFKSFDYYCASRRKLAHYSCIPNTFPALKRTAPFFREKYGLSSAPVFTCPASAQHEETAASLHPPCETHPSSADHVSFSHSPAQFLCGTNGTGYRG